MATKVHNTQWWTKLSQPPPSALKIIKGGRLKGMTDINPQWRLEVMTEVFGPCGVGWKYTIDRLWTEEGKEEVMAFALVSLYIWEPCPETTEFSDPIPGIGGNKLVAVEKGGVHNNDEAYKMAVTDALSVAMKSLGVASDIYAGLWDGSKYQKRPEFTVTQTVLNSLKKKWSEAKAKELTGLDRVAMQQKFSKWCKDIIGELVDYHEPASWERDWIDTCVAKLNGGVDADVPFDAE